MVGKSRGSVLSYRGSVFLSALLLSASPIALAGAANADGTEQPGAVQEAARTQVAQNSFTKVLSDRAVSQLNGAVDLRGGFFESDNQDLDGGAGFVSGKFAVPLTDDFGFQGEAALGTIDGETAGGFGGHLFWRDPNQALIGIIAHYAAVDEAEAFRFGVEGEAYIDQITLSATAGLQEGEDGVPDGGFGSVRLGFYPQENLLLHGGGAIADDDLRGFAGFEYQIDQHLGSIELNGVSVFGEVTAGDNDLVAGFLGLRYYFAEPKSLIRRHREDDPPSLLGPMITEMSQGMEAPDSGNGNKKKNKCPSDADSGSSCNGGGGDGGDDDPPDADDPGDDSDGGTGDDGRDGGDGDGDGGDGGGLDDGRDGDGGGDGDGLDDGRDPDDEPGDPSDDPPPPPPGDEGDDDQDDPDAGPVDDPPPPPPDDEDNGRS
ncbi:MAG: hypothetical protein R3316_01080 [Rhodovibrionaceae bacterium]|nr:hypothetical protein [Rhodovibrionaceae bacterium]